MSRRVGFIQTGGIGDLIMILPIADYFEEQGWEVVWPIDEKFVPMFQRAKPLIRFLPVEGSPSDARPYYLDQPLRLIEESSCEKTVVFYLNFLGINIADTRLSKSLKTDEYKYAIAGVPLKQKWNLDYERDVAREEALFDSLQIDGPYICVHEEASSLSVPMPAGTDENCRVIKVEPLTDSVFDWRLTFERASRLIFIESCFANLVEQLRLPVEKDLVLRTVSGFTPVYRSGWNFTYLNPADIARPGR